MLQLGFCRSTCLRRRFGRMFKPSLTPFHLVFSFPMAGSAVLPVNVGLLPAAILAICFQVGIAHDSSQVVLAKN